MKIDKKLIQQYIAGTIAEGALPTVIAWLDESPEHVKEFMALHKVYQVSLLNRPMLQTTIQLLQKHRKVKAFLYEVLKVAAILLLVWGGSYLYHSTTEDTTYQSLYVPAGQRAELTLPDGTKVWINAQSKIKYPLSFRKDKRTVELDGEAFFDVTKNKDKPFCVKTKNVSVQVLGTEFDLKAYANRPRAEVFLLKGKVALYDAAHKKRVEMKPNEYVCYKDGQFEKGSIKDENYFKWRMGIISFKNESVHELFKKLELYYDIHIDVKRKNILREHYTGKFRTKDGIEQVLNVLQIEHNFTYTIDKEKNILTIK